MLYFKTSISLAHVWFLGDASSNSKLIKNAEKQRVGQCTYKQNSLAGLTMIPEMESGN